MNPFRELRRLSVFTIIAIFLMVSCFLTVSLSQTSSSSIWYVRDTIEPSLDEIRWREEGAVDEAQSWISDGTWFEMSRRESLVNAQDIFVSMYERFNWSQVKSLYDLPFSNFEDFAQYVVDNPLWWINDVWEIDASWYGISSNMSRIAYSFNSVDSEVKLWTYFHITRVPEYFMGSERLASWLVGFDLTSISLGSLRIYEFYEDSGIKGTHYNLFFVASATMLTQHLGNYTLKVDVAPSYRGRSYGIQQVIDIYMPADTEVKEMLPANLSLLHGNTASFIISENDLFPSQFVVVSGPPTKSLSQVFWEGASLWLLTPGGWAAMATLTVLTFTALRGRRIWRRRKTYHRMYNSMVTVFDLYSSDILKFHQEMGNISSSIFKLLIDDKITDDQFEKLLLRRDDLLRRVQGNVPSPPR